MTELELDWYAFSAVYDLLLFQKFIFISFLLYDPLFFAIRG